jgi:hypothetical protein
VPGTILTVVAFHGTGTETGLGSRATPRWSFSQQQAMEDHAAQLLTRHRGKRVDCVWPFLASFERPIDGVAFCLAFRRGAVESEWCRWFGYGVHLGEVNDAGDDLGKHGRDAVDVASSVARLATIGQVLLTRPAFEIARRSAVGEPPAGEPLRWVEHGRYPIDGDSLEICEVGVQGGAAFAPPPSPQNQSTSSGTPSGLATRGAPVPDRSHWLYERMLGRNELGESWLIRHTKTREGRRLRLSRSAAGREALSAEVASFERWRQHLGPREDLVPLLDWRLDSEPYSIEMEWGDSLALPEWRREAGTSEQTRQDRLPLVIHAAETLAALHEIGVVHGRLRPESILVREGLDGSANPCLADVGCRLEDRELESDPWTAPELRSSQPSPATDLYALGTIMYQCVVDDFTRRIEAFWERDVSDDATREQIARLVDRDPAARRFLPPRPSTADAREPSASVPSVGASDGSNTWRRLVWILLAVLVGFVLGRLG